jgi:YVTN family beta-propeller protein
VNPSTNRIYVAHPSSGTVTVINGSNNSTATVSSGSNTIAVAVNSITNKIYASNGDGTTVTVINGADNTTQFISGFRPGYLAVNSATNKIYVASPDTNDVRVIDGTNNSTIATIPTGSNPGPIVVNSTTNKIYVAAFDQKLVTVINGSTDSSSCAPTTATISGRVTNGNGDGINSATIKFTDPNFNEYFTITSSNGNYIISNLPLGQNYTVSGADFGTRVYGQPESVLSPLTANVTGLNLAKITPNYTAAGTVTINGGGDLTGLTVTPVPPNSPFGAPTPCPTPYTGGNFQCLGLWEGTVYDIVPEKPNYVFTPSPVRVSNNNFAIQYTGNPLAFVTTTTASSVAMTTATLNGTVNPNGIATNGWFEWGTDPTLTTNSSTAVQAKGSGNTSQPLTQAISSLAAGTTFYFRAVASNAAGIVKGSILSFTTTSPPRTLTISSSNPNSGVSITVSPNDNSSQGNGTTQFTRTYNNNQVVSLTAPGTAAGNTFQKWLKNGADFANNTNTNASVTMDADHTITAVYVTPNSIQFDSASYAAAENVGSKVITITRTGNTASPATLNYATSDGAAANPCSTVNGNASSRCDYLTTLGILTFAPGETSRTISIPVIDDAYAEGNETLTLTLSNAVGAGLGSPSSAPVTITDNESSNGPNPISDPSYFVRLHYLDFLNREPDAGGWNFWTGQTTSCGNPDLLVCRVNVSGSFFLSIEFQETGYLVERAYKTAYGDATGTSTFGGTHQLPVPVVRFDEFLADTQQITKGVIVLQPGWEQLLESNKVAFFADFVQRSRFTTAFPTSMTPAQFVDTLNANAGNVLSSSERTTAINLFSGAGNTTNVTARALALRQVAEDSTLVSAEVNRAFVLMQYFGYLRRNPNDPQDSDYTGYDFWLTKLNQFGGNYISAEMVKAFITSIEYEKRFGP